MILFDNKANTGALTSGASTYSWNHTIGSGTNIGLIVSLHWFNGSALTISTMTYNGIAMTQIGTTITDGTGDYIAIFYLRAPTVGTNSISVTFSAGPGFFIGGSQSWFGLDQTTATSGIEATASNTGTAATISVSITTVSLGAYYYATCFDDPSGASGTITAGDGQTETYNVTNAGGEDAEGYKGPFVANTSHTPSWAVTSTGPRWVIIAESLKPASNQNLSLLGVGT